MSRGQYTGMAIGIMGIAVLLLVDYRIAIGVFLVMWGDNLSRSTEDT